MHIQIDVNRSCLHYSSGSYLNAPGNACLAKGFSRIGTNPRHA
jgi:hypothetical protein